MSGRREISMTQIDQSILASSTFFQTSEKSLVFIRILPPYLLSSVHIQSLIRTY